MPTPCSGSKTRIAVQRPDVGFRRLRTRLTFKPTQPSVARVEVSCPAEGEQRSGHSGLCFPQFAFSNDARIRFFQILDAIFELALILWEPLGHLVGSAWHIPIAGLRAILNLCEGMGTPRIFARAVSAGRRGATQNPSRVCGYVAPPRPGPDHRPTNGGHCGGNGSVLRFRALVAMTNWRGLRQPHALL
jgi:hypothetical protein